MQKTRKSAFGRIVALCMALFVLVLLPPLNAVAAEKSASLTIQYKADTTALPGAFFALYRVADVAVDGPFQPSGSFANSRVSLANLDADGWRIAANTLAAYAEANGVRALASGETSRDGTLAFRDLQVGLYLVVGQRQLINNYLYTPQPFFVCLPGQGATGGFTYDVTAEPKHTREDPSTEPGTLSRKALKVWNDGDDQSKRPTEVTAVLLCDGAVYSTVVLNAKNNWRHEWTGLNGACMWRVMEQAVPQGYTVAINLEGTTFVITNTRPAEIPTGEPKQDLPKTGMLWWPMPLLVLAGLLLFVTGWVMHQRAKTDDDA